jgi:hypothetical protein
MQDTHIDQYFADVIYESDICALMIIDYYYKIDGVKNNKEMVVRYLNDVADSLKDKYGSDWKPASWLSRYWLLLYNNETNWNLHKVPGYKDTILGHASLDKITARNKSMQKKLRIFQIMKEKEILLLDYGFIERT